MLRPLFLNNYFNPPRPTRTYSVAQIIIGFDNLNDLVYEKILDSRDYSTTYLVNYRDEPLVVKWIYFLNKKLDLGRIEQEIQLQLQCAAAGLAPLIKGAFILHDSSGIIIMEKLDIELARYLIDPCRAKQTHEDHSRDLHQLIKLVESCHGLGIAHHDLGASNVMIKFNPTNYAPQFKLIDFGFSCNFTHETDEKQLYLKIVDFMALRGAIRDLHAEFGYSYLEKMDHELGDYILSRYDRSLK